MKRSTIITLVVLAVLLLWSVSTYNGLVKSQEGVEKAWSDVENQYQRRLDLIDNLVSTVKGYANHEQQTLTQVIEARAQAIQTKINIDNLTEENLKKFQEAQSELNSTLSRLMAISESYPDLKANENFLQLQAQLEGTENRVAVERRNFNTAAQEYNQKIRRIPAVLIARFMGFDKKPYFQATEGAERAPKVQF